MQRYIQLVFAIISIIALPAAVLGHGTGYRVISASPVIAAEFFYSDNEPMRYAEVLVFSPDNAEIEYQNGRTDKNGRFAFYPEIPGKWRIEVNDGMGHAVRAAIDVEAQEIPSESAEGMPRQTKPPAVGASMAMKVCLGLSLLLNLFLGLYFWKSNPRRITKH